MPKNAKAINEGNAKGDDVGTEVIKQVLKRVHGRSLKEETVLKGEAEASEWW
jgi:hypothetical protein